MALLTFIIPVRHQDNAKDWRQLAANLAQTVASISNQSNNDWSAVIVANEGAELPRLPDRFSVARVTFPPNDMHELGKQGREAFLDAFRADKGRRVLSGMLRARESGYFMIVDDDDFVSARIVEFVGKNAGDNGWKIDRGFLWSNESRLLLAHNNFSRLCGTSLIVRSDLYNLPSSLEAASIEWVKSWLGSHILIGPELERRGTPLASLPFRGAVYRVGHAGSHSQAKGVLATYAFNRNAFRRPRNFLGTLARLRRIGPGARREFFGVR